MERGRLARNENHVKIIQTRPENNDKQPTFALQMPKTRSTFRKQRDVSLFLVNFGIFLYFFSLDGTPTTIHRDGQHKHL